jgi:hypothetical protein
MAETTAAKTRIFISYAHADEALKTEFDKYLKVLRRSGKIAVWQDRQLLAGDEWNATILRELGLANLILLLVSVDFNASDFIWDTERAAAMPRHAEGTARVVPIILRPCQWSSLPYAKLQALPRNARPVTDHPDRDAAFTEIATEIERLVDQMNAQA